MADSTLQETITPTKQTLFNCPSCGRLIPTDGIFCPYYGRQLATGNSPQQPSKAKNSKMPIFGYTLLTSKKGREGAAQWS